VSAIAATGAGVTLTAGQAQALEAAAIGLRAPSGSSNAIADTAAHVEALTTAEIAGLSALHVTQIATSDGGAVLSVAQAAALETAKVGLAAPARADNALGDTAAHIAALTTTQIAGLSGLHVDQIAAGDATIALTVAQAMAFESAYVALSAPSGSIVVISDTAAHLQALTAAEIAGLPATGVDELYSSNANVSYDAAQTSAILAACQTVAATGSDTITENFANGDYSVYANGALHSQKTVNADGSYDIANLLVTGQTYTSDEYVHGSSGAKAAFATDNPGGSGTLTIDGSGDVVSTAPGQLSFTVGSDAFALDAHANETIAAAGAPGAEFEFAPASGLAQPSWQDLLSGFVATGSAHETLEFSASAFGAGLTAADQTADWRALVSLMTQNSASQAVINDLHGDTLTVAGVTKATLTAAANAGDFRFV
jgi:hypothetical protein